MMPNKTSLILDDKNERHDLISRVIALIVDEFDCRFQITHLTNLDAFTPAEKEYLISVFAPDITSLYIWQYSFRRDEDFWIFESSPSGNYHATFQEIFLLLNHSAFSLGDIVDPDDPVTIETMLQDWFGNMDDELRILYDIGFEETECVEFVRKALKTRVGKPCRYLFPFVKAFMEALADYNMKKVEDAILGKNTI